MSISTTTRKAGPFAGNGIQTVFPFGFKVFAAADVLVARANALGVESILELGVDFTVTLNPNQDEAPGGSITLTAPLAVTTTLAATSAISALQPVTVTNGGGFFPAVFNGVFDRLTILVQQLAEKMSRSMSIPLTSQVQSLEVPVLASAVLQWSADGTRLTAVSLPDLSLSLALPPMGGRAGQFLTNDGASLASWNWAPVLSVAGLTGGIGVAPLKNALAITVGDVTDYASDQAAKQAAAAAALAASQAFALNAAALL